MEYLGGDDLYKRICQTGALSGIDCFSSFFNHAEWESARIVRHIARGLEALHEKQILHLDVKLENVIFESKEPNSLMKLADFGCCYVQDVEERPPDEIIGTAGYIAPEIISVAMKNSADVQNLQYSAACDVYSLGVLLYILLIGYPPYQGNDTREILLFTLYQSVDVFTQQKRHDRFSLRRVEFHQPERAESREAHARKGPRKADYAPRSLGKRVGRRASASWLAAAAALHAVDAGFADESPVDAAWKPLLW